jgi:peptidoglycan/LPS O-acetylase OafA/YrhL
LLSGFLITGILFDMKGSPHYFRDFYARRILRIFPLYYLVLLGSTLLVWFVCPSDQKVLHGTDSMMWYWCYAANIAYTIKGTWLQSPTWTHFSHFWSLAVEEQFYLIWPIVMYFSSTRTLVRVCLVVMCVALPIQTMVGNLVNYGVAYQFTLCRIGALVLGGWLSLQLRTNPPTWSMLARWAPSLAIIMGGVLVAEMFTVENGSVPIDVTVWVCFASMLVSALTAPQTSMWRRFLESRVMRFFGRYSYALYVFHHLFRTVWDYKIGVAPFERFTGSHALGLILHGTCIAATSIVISVLSWHLFEKHFLRLKRFFRTRERTLPIARSIAP